MLGGAGFLGSHVCTWLVYSGAQVTCLDNMFTGNAANVAHLMGDRKFRLIDYDVTDYIHVPGQVDYVMNFASPASPVALENRPLPVHGDGSQTRSLCYVDDQVEGILRLLLSSEIEPVNIGNPEEVTVLELAEAIQDVIGTHPGVEFLDRPTDDPNVRRPDTTKAEEVLGWKAQVSLRQGLERTAPWFREVLGL